MTKQNDEIYDSSVDTRKHIDRVNQLFDQFCIEASSQISEHDKSKLGEDEKPYFDAETPLLKTLVFGSEEYKESLSRLGIALSHHYQNNRHHPEHFDYGVDEMDLIDIVEMLLDWKAASERGKTGVCDLQTCYARFNIGLQLQNILNNTFKRLFP